MIPIAFFTLSNGQIAIVTADGYREFGDFRAAADYAARLSPAIQFPYPPLPDESPPEPAEGRKAPTASARVSLACGHVLDLRGWSYYLIPRIGDLLWCYQCAPGDEKEVTQVEML